MKKYLALLLALCMVFSVFSGLGIMASAGEPIPWNIGARLAPSLTDKTAAANNDKAAKAAVTMEDNVITITANVDELEESESSDPAQGTHKWIGLGIDTGLETVEGVLYNGGALSAGDQDEAKLVGLDDGEFILYIKADEVTPQNPKVITLGAEGHEDIELTIQVVTPWNISARLAPSLTEEIPAANNDKAAKAAVTMEDNVITITANVDELEESASSVPAQGTHKWIGLGINTGLSDLTLVKYGDYQFTEADAAEAKLVGLDQDGEFILYIKADEVTPQNPKVITLGAEGHEDIELTIQVVTPWNIGARLAPSLTEEIPAANNAKAKVTKEDNVITITANVDELEESASSVPAQGTHKWIGLGIDTGLETVEGVLYNGGALSAGDQDEAKLVGLDDGEFILYIKADEVTPQNPKVITLGAECHEDIELTIQVVKHTFVYTAKDNMLIEMCIACDHYETATITAENTTYTGSAIENAKVTYSDGWQGGELTVVYENNKNVGTATAKITVDETTAKTTFSVYNRTSVSGGTVKLEPLEPQMSMLPEAIRGFIDIPASAWYKDAAAYVVEKGLMTGTSATTFAPESTMTRAMLMTVLARNAGADTNGGETWYEKGMAWAKKNGISDGTNPTGNITREQLVTMLYRAAKEPKVSGELSFTDANTVSAYAQDAMRWAVANGIVTGMGDGTVAPTATATRAQVAAILMRYLELGK